MGSGFLAARKHKDTFLTLLKIAKQGTVER
jgi:hypothetical protein